MVFAKFDENLLIKDCEMSDSHDIMLGGYFQNPHDSHPRILGGGGGGWGGGASRLYPKSH